MQINLPAYQEEVAQELNDILGYWMRNTVDQQGGGFFGTIDQLNHADPKAAKGVVLNSRILWTFSAAYNQAKNSQYLAMAHMAYDYISAHFMDSKYGGVYWSVDHSGAMLNGRKQIYGIAFCIYAFSEYYQAVNNPEVLDQAIGLFRIVEQYGYDEKRKGYYEAFTREWGQEEDLRLSEKDANEKKTMNTHLHIIEAYSNLYKVWPDALLKLQIENLLEVFANYIINPTTGHLGLFFDEDWNLRSHIISFGHDIEAAWLLQEAATVIQNNHWIKTMQAVAIRTAGATEIGLDEDGGLWYEYDARTHHLVREKHWWPQAEAMVGFFNAFEISDDETFLQRSVQSWEFIKKYIRDNNHGEWFWGIDANHSIMPGQDKAGFWKCPYHNSRACMEIIKRINKMSSKQPA